MFGEDIIIVNKISPVDKKTRVSIPKDSGVEKDELLVLVRGETPKTYYIYSYNYYISWLNELKKKIQCKDLKGYINALREIDNEFIKLINKFVIDSQGRVVLGPEFSGVTQVEFHGCGDHLRVDKVESKEKQKVK